MLPSLPAVLAAGLAAIAGVEARPQQASPVSRSTACNNSPTLCSMAYNKITFMGAHDSAFLRDDSTNDSIAGNQYKNATTALDAGLRFLQAQVHDTNGTLELCHTSCELLDAGSLESFLASIADWMASNPNDVVTILLVNSDNKDVSTFGSAFQSSGLSKYAYKPTTTGATGDWPTLQTMISANTRLVSFVTSIDASPTYPYLLSEFDYVFETTFQVTTLTGFNCTLDRPSQESTAATALSANFLGLINHFKDQAVSAGIVVPDVTNIATVNSAATNEDGELGKHLQQCQTEWGVKPNFVLVDFWNQGNTIGAADHINGLNDIVGRSGGGATANANGQSLGSRNGQDLAHAALLAFFAGAMLLV